MCKKLVGEMMLPKKPGSAEKVSNEIPMLPRRVPQIFFKLLNVSYGDRSDGLRHL